MTSDRFEDVGLFASREISLKRINLAGEDPKGCFFERKMDALQGAKDRKIFSLKKKVMKLELQIDRNEKELARLRTDQKEDDELASNFKLHRLELGRDLDPMRNAEDQLFIDECVQAVKDLREVKRKRSHAMKEIDTKILTFKLERGKLKAKIDAYQSQKDNAREKKALLDGFRDVQQRKRKTSLDKAKENMKKRRQQFLVKMRREKQDL